MPSGRAPRTRSAKVFPKWPSNGSRDPPGRPEDVPGRPREAPGRLQAAPQEAPGAPQEGPGRLQEAPGTAQGPPRGPPGRKKMEPKWARNRTSHPDPFRRPILPLQEPPKQPQKVYPGPPPDLRNRHFPISFCTFLCIRPRRPQSGPRLPSIGREPPPGGLRPVRTPSGGRSGPPGGLQNYLKTSNPEPLNGPKNIERRPRATPGRSRDGPKTPQEDPRRCQDAPRRRQDGPRRARDARRRLWNAPVSSPGRPGMLPGPRDRRFHNIKHTCLA